MGIRMMRRLAVVLAAAFAVLVLTPATASAHDCSSDADCEQTGGYNGAIAVVGGVAAVLAAAAAAATRTPKGEETDLAILQLDVNDVEVGPDNPATVTLTGWHVGSDGQPARVPMTIWIDAPAGCGVTVVPEQGEGLLVATISLDPQSPTDADRIELLAHGVWKGKEATETITVRLGGDLELHLY
jgi:hypothetical protein